MSTNTTLSSKHRLVLFVRHGETNISGSLTDKGYEQASITASFLLNKIISAGTENITIFASPQDSTMQSIVPFIEKLREENKNFNLKILQNSYEYRRPNNGDTAYEIKGKKYPVKVDKTWNDFIKRIDHTKKIIETDLKNKEKKLIIFYGHSLFFSTLFSNFIICGDHYPKHYKQISIHLPNCSISCFGNDINSNHWDTFFMGMTNHMDQLTTGNHVDFNFN